MRNTLKATTIENKLPLLAVENGCIVSKDADLTVAFEVTLPELYTVTSQEYETIHGCWCKAIKVLPDYSIVHKQDWFIRETYKPELQKDGMTFLSRSFERHFNERPFLKHTCYLYLTKTTKERNRMQSNFSTLCRGHIIPKELNKETATRFLESVEQFERIMNDSGFIRLRKLSDNEIVGTRRKAGLIERYLSLNPEDNASLQDIDLDPAEMRIGDNRLYLFTLSDVNDLPARVGTDVRYERLSTDRSDCRLSFASPVGLLLPCNHIYNQYVILDNSDDNLQRFEKTARNMQSLSRYSRSNAINKEWIDMYLNEAHSQGLISVRAHYNVIAWSDDAEELKHQRGRLPCRRVILYIHRACGLPLYGGNELPQFALSLRHQDGGQTDGKAAAHRHLGFADEEGRHYQPQQIRAGTVGKRKVVLHEPRRPPVLRAGNPCRAD